MPLVPRSPRNHLRTQLATGRRESGAPCAGPGPFPAARAEQAAFTNYLTHSRLTSPAPRPQPQLRHHHLLPHRQIPRPPLRVQQLVAAPNSSSSSSHELLDVAPARRAAGRHGAASHAAAGCGAAAGRGAAASGPEEDSPNHHRVRRRQRPGAPQRGELLREELQSPAREVRRLPLPAWRQPLGLLLLGAPPRAGVCELAGSPCPLESAGRVHQPPGTGHSS